MTNEEIAVRLAAGVVIPLAEGSELGGDMPGRTTPAVPKVAKTAVAIYRAILEELRAG